MGVSINRDISQNGWFIMDNLFKMDDFGVPQGNSDMVSGSRARICAGFRGDDLCHLLGWHDDAHLGPRDVGLLEQPVRSMAWWCRIKAFWIFLDLFGSFWIFLDLFGSFWIFLDLFGSFWIFFQYCGRCILESCVNMCQLIVNSLNKTWSCHVQDLMGRTCIAVLEGHASRVTCLREVLRSFRAPVPMLCSHAASSLLVLRLQLEAEIGPECFGCLPGSVLVTLISSWDPSEYIRDIREMIQPWSSQKPGLHTEALGHWKTMVRGRAPAVKSLELLWTSPAARRRFAATLEQSQCYAEAPCREGDVLCFKIQAYPGYLCSRSVPNPMAMEVWTAKKMQKENKRNVISDCSTLFCSPLYPNIHVE